MARAGSATIGALRVVLSADTAAFETGLKNARSQLSSFGAGIGKAMAVIGAAVAAGLGAAAVAIKSTLNQADELGKAAQKFGIPVEELSKLKYAADLSGVSLDSLGTAFRKLSQNMQEVAAGRGQQASEAFRALGISVTDANGKLKSSQEIMLEVAERFAAVEDGANKTALAMAIFGRSGTDLIPLLNAGRDGIKQMTDEAERFGLVIDTKTAKSAESFNDNLSRLKAAFDGLIIRVTSALAPALAELTDNFVEIVKSGDLAQKVVDSFGFVMQQAAFFTAHANASLAEFTRWGQAIGEVTNALAEADFSAAGSALIRARDDVSRITDGLKQKLDEIRNGFGVNFQGKGDRLDIDVDKPQAPSLRTQADIKAESDLLKQQEEQARNTATAWEQLRLAGQKVFQETLTPAEKLKFEIAELNNLLNQGAIDWETYSRGVEKAQADFDKAAAKTNKLWSQVGKTISSEVGDAIKGLIDGTYSWGDALQSLSSIIGRLSTKLLDSGINALFSGFFGGGSQPDFAGLYASGGRIPSGAFGVVGENGPEFVQGPANVIPQGDLRGGATQIIIENHGAQIEQREEQRGGMDTRRFIIRAVKDTIAGGFADPEMRRFGLSPQTGRR